MDQHKTYDRYCVENENTDISKICNDACFGNLDIVSNTICEKCMNEFYKQNHNKIHAEIRNENSHSMLFIGYMCKNNKKYDIMKEYLLMSIKEKNAIAMFVLGEYYYHERNNDLMKKYYLQSIDNGYVRAMNHLGTYYCDIEQNYDLMKKYYLMAIDKDDSESMTDLAYYYHHIEDYSNLGYFYQHTDEEFHLMKKYYMMAINKGDVRALQNFCYALSKFDNFSDIIKIYYSINNKQFIIDHMIELEYHSRSTLQTFIENASVQICQSCYLENECCVKNNIYLCGLCF